MIKQSPAAPMQSGRMMAGAVLLTPSRRTQEIVPPMPPYVTCSIPECANPVDSRGWCKPHYDRWYYHGDPLATKSAIRRSPSERFWAKVEKTQGCWLWTGYRAHAGHGRFSLGHRVPVPAHRFAYEELVGPIPAGMELDHLCRNPPCVRPSHLEPVSRAVNNERSFSATAQNKRKTFCKSGHPFDEINTYLRPTGGRGCKVCRAEASRMSER